MGLDSSNIENLKKRDGEGFFISEKTPRIILAALGIAAASSITIGYLTGNFDDEPQVLDETIVDCAVILTDEDPTLQEAVLNIQRCDTRGSLDETETEIHAQKTLAVATEIRE
jgi:hypothetical protein